MECQEDKIVMNMIVADVLKKYPQTAKVFHSIGARCKGCPSATSETIAHAALGHGVDLSDLLEKLNKAVCEEKK